MNQDEMNRINAQLIHAEKLLQKAKDDLSRFHFEMVATANTFKVQGGYPTLEEVPASKQE